MRYRLALDLGTTSIGWALVRLDASEPPLPTAIIRAGVRLFGDGREPARGKGEVGSSLAVTRRLARQMRRRRDRQLRRKNRIVSALVQLGFWPKEVALQKALEGVDPYTLRRKGLDQALTAAEFGRALFHLNQRRGFKSNRKTDKGDPDSGLLKGAIKKLKNSIELENCRTVGEWLARRHDKRESVRARLRGKTVRDKAYDLYIDRAMVAHEFDTLWAAQSAFHPALFTETSRVELKRELLYQRPLKPVVPGKCTLIPTEPRAALALPSVQRFRVYQELNNLRILSKLNEVPLTLEQRDTLAARLERDKVTFTQMRKALGFAAGTKFNLEDAKRSELKGNFASRELAKESRFGEAWFGFSETLQDEIVTQLVSQADEQVLIDWLIENCGVDEATAEGVASANLPEGYGNLSAAAIALVLPELRAEVTTYDKAVVAAGMRSHSDLDAARENGEILQALPYYGEALQRHVGFVDDIAKPDDLPEKRFGRIANPTVHIGLNELRKVVNKLILQYGHPSQVVVEVARELKQGQQQRRDEHERQAARQEENETYKTKIRELGQAADKHVSAKDVRLMRLWTELNPADAANRCCPYTGQAIGMAMLFSGEVEIEHILPFSMTLDDSLNNQTVAMRRANRDKGNRTPFEAFGHSPDGYNFDAIQQRASHMPTSKRKRFAEGAYEAWLRDDKDFLARALTDTAYLSRIAREYLSLVCPPNAVWVIPGRMTALLRRRFGLDDILGLKGEKNRNDHRHHAVDAAVIGVTDRSLLQRFAKANAAARDKGLDRLVEDMPLPWKTYREHVSRAVHNIVVSHRPDHGHQGALHNATAYGLLPDGLVSHRVMLDGFKSAAEVEKKTFAGTKLQQELLAATAGLSGKDFAARLQTFQAATGVRRVKLVEPLQVIPMTYAAANDRHGVDENGEPVPYKGYKGDSNYCIEIWRDPKGKWRGEVISTFEAHRIEREHSRERLRHPTLAQNGQPLVMRLVSGDCVRLDHEGTTRLMRLVTASSEGRLSLVDVNEGNVDARMRDANDPFAYVFKMAGTMQKSSARKVWVSEIGVVRDPGFSH
jgi:CRISPR-associated endonuclease Csn1